MKTKYALLSVSDETGIVEFATTLHHSHRTILSTGGTVKGLREVGLQVMDISGYTGFS